MHNPLEQCASCGTSLDGQTAWLGLDGALTCVECAMAVAALRVRVPSRPEARDDGR